MKGVIDICGIKIHAFHGCMEEESKVGTAFEVDISLCTDISKAVDSDSLEHTVDYVEVNQVVQQEMRVRSELIEHVAKRILDRLLKEISRIETAKVTVRKYNAPMGGQVDYVSITIEG